MNSYQQFEKQAKKDARKKSRNSRWAKCKDAINVIAQVVTIFGLSATAITVYNSAHPSPVEELSKQVHDYMNDVSRWSVVDIPDSLINDRIIELRDIQRKILVNSKISSLCMVSSIEQFNSLDNGNVLLASMSQMMLLQRAGTAFSNNFKILSESVQIAQEHPQAFPAIEIITCELLGVYQSQTKYATTTPLCLTELTSIQSEFRTTKNEKRRKELSEKVLNIIEEYSTSQEYADYISTQMSLSRKFFDYLNVLQLCIAYNNEIETLDEIVGKDKINLDFKF